MTSLLKKRNIKKSKGRKEFNTHFKNLGKKLKWN